MTIPPGPALIVARAQNRVIGNHGKLPWSFPEDLRYFRRVTIGHSVIMGRRTHESIGKALPARNNIVVSSTFEPADGVLVARSLDEALSLVPTDHRPYIVGGASLYAEALPRAQSLWITEVHLEVDGDVFFPEFDESLFAEIERHDGEDPRLVFRVLVRKQPS